MFKEAIRQSATSHDPFLNYRLSKSEHSPREILDKEQVDALFALWEEGTLPGYLQTTLHYFLMACHVGVRYSDWPQLSEENVREGYLLIQPEKMNRDKSKRIEFPIVSTRLQQLLAASKYLRAPYCNQATNRYLKELMDMVGIDKPISSHAARATFVNLAQNEYKVSTFQISKLVGHSSTKITEEHYLRHNRDIGRRAMEAWKE